MTPLISTLLGMTSILLGRTELHAAGYTDTEIRTQIRRGTLRRLAAGTYVLAEPYDALDPAERERLRVLASAAGVTGLVISHASAATVHRLPLMAQPSETVHFTRVGRGGSRSTRWRQIHAADLRHHTIARSDGFAVTTVAQTVVDLGRTVPTRAAVVTADAALNRRLTTMAQLDVAVDEARLRAGHPRAQRMLGLVDGRSESPGETLTRLILREAGITDLELQVEVADERGHLIGRADLACRSAGVLIEFDGKIKYGALLKPDQTLDDVILAERAREKRMIELGWLVLRVVWNDLGNHPRLVARVRRACAAQRPVAWRIRGTAVPRPPL